MTDVPDFRGRVESDKPTDFFHKIAGIIPGYNGYQDRERRRDADRELRQYLARRFREQTAALMRVQQAMLRAGRITEISEVDRLNGVLQRFIDKLETATQGYAGLFDPVKVDMAELDQLYTFDAALTGGLQQVTDAITGIGNAAKPGAEAGKDQPDLDTALANLGTVLDDLLTTWNHRNEVIMSGRPMPADDFNKFRANVAGAQTAPLAGTPPVGGTPSYAAPPPPPAPPAPAYGGAPQGQGYQPYAGGPAVPPSPAAPQAQPYQGYSGPAAPQTQPYQPYSGEPAAPPSPQPYQPYAGEAPQPPPSLDSPETARLTPPSNTGGGPTGGPADSGTPGAGQ